MLPELTARRVDVTQKGPTSRLPEKSSEKRSEGEGPQEKVYQRRSVEKGPLKKVH